MWNVIIPVLAFVVGLALGVVGGAYVLKKKMSDMANFDEKKIAAMASSMGMNLNHKQLKMATQKIQKLQGKKKK